MQVGLPPINDVLRNEIIEQPKVEKKDGVNWIGMIKKFATGNDAKTDVTNSRDITISPTSSAFLNLDIGSNNQTLNHTENTDFLTLSLSPLQSTNTETQEDSSFKP